MTSPFITSSSYLEAAVVVRIELGVSGKRPIIIVESCEVVLLHSLEGQVSSCILNPEKGFCSDVRTHFANPSLSSSQTSKLVYIYLNLN